jgi:single-stranded DNA-binding protein
MPPNFELAPEPSAGDFASITVCGRLNRAPELRHTPDGTPVTTLSLSATLENEPFYWDFHLFGSRAEDAVANFRLGSRLLVVGKPEKNRFFTKAGQPATRITYKAKEVSFISGGA